MTPPTIQEALEDLDRIGDQAVGNSGFSVRETFEEGFATIRLALEAAALEAERPAWVAVGERMPPTGVTVLAWGGCAMFDGIDWRSMTGSSAFRKIEWTVTHWMPLPSPPEST